MKRIGSLLICIIYCITCFQYKSVSYNPITWLILILSLILVYHHNIYNKEFFKPSIIFSLIFSIFMVLGKICLNNLYVADKLIWTELFKIKYIIIFLSSFILIYMIMINIIPSLIKLSVSGKNTNISNKKMFIISFLLIFICWIPYFLSMYPGCLTYDSFVELKTIMNNFNNMSNHVPIIHTIILSIPYNLGMVIFNNSNVAASCCTIFQMIFMAIIYSYLITFLYKRKIKRKVIFICIMYFALMPMHAYLSVTMWKDVPFAGLMILLTIKLIDFCDKGISSKRLLSYSFLSLIVILFRNNAVYMYILLSIIMLIIFKKHFKQILLSSIVIIGLYFVIIGPLFNILKIKKSASVEYIAIPLQQVARMSYKNVIFSETETELIDNLVGVDNLNKYYNPELVDPVKSTDIYNLEYFDKNKFEMFKLWLELTIKHPGVSSESYLISTLGYWYPGVNYWAVAKEIDNQELGFYRDSKASELVNSYVYNIEYKTNPIINMGWSTSLSYWILLIFAYITTKKKETKYLVSFVPIFGLWLTLMIATPVYAEYRYVYPSYTCLPLLMLLPYVKKEIVKNRKKI